MATSQLGPITPQLPSAQCLNLAMQTAVAGATRAAPRLALTRLPKAPEGFRVVTATKLQAYWVMDATRREGWNKCRSDIEALYATDPEGFFVGLLHGQPISSASVIVVSPTLAGTGMFTVAPEHRGSNMGVWTIHPILGRANQVLAAGGTIAGASSGGTQTPFYESMGYRKGHTAVRLQLTLADPATVRCTSHPSLPDKVLDVPCSAAADPQGWRALMQYDRLCFPDTRERFLAQFFLRNPSVQWVDEGGVVRGYGVIRRADVGFRVGPLFADDASIAGALVAALCSRVPRGAGTGPVFVDVPEWSLAPLLASLRSSVHEVTAVQEVSRTLRVWAGVDPLTRYDTARVFGETTNGECL